MNISIDDVISHFSDFSFEIQPSLLQGNQTSNEIKRIGDNEIKYFINEYWTSRQRQSSSIHEISYRACFKAELPRFFITLLTKEGNVVYDPFMGRGTTLVESAILNRNIIGNDINPLSTYLVYPRLHIPDLVQIENRLTNIYFRAFIMAGRDIS